MTVVNQGFRFFDVGDFFPSILVEIFENRWWELLRSHTSPYVLLICFHVCYCKC